MDCIALVFTYLKAKEDVEIMKVKLKCERFMYLKVEPPKMVDLHHQPPTLRQVKQTGHARMNNHGMNGTSSVEASSSTGYSNAFSQRDDEGDDDELRDHRQLDTPSGPFEDAALDIDSSE